MSSKKKIIIIGGVAGGASAAARARRLSEDAEIIIFEKGEHISFANCGLPYHIGGDIADRERLLLLTPEMMYKNRRIDARVNTEVVKIDRKNKIVHVCNWKEKRDYEESYTDLILSPGAKPFRPDLPGIQSSKIFSLRDINNMDEIIHVVGKDKNQNALVIGGGFIGLEIVEALVKKGKKVTLVEKADAVMPPVDIEMASMLQQELLLNGVTVHTGVSVEAFKDNLFGMKAKLDNGESIKCDFVILAIGVKPEIALAQSAELAIGERGGILVDEYMRTNDPSIYAVGDAVEVKDFISGENTLLPLAGPANRQGRTAADNIFGRKSKYTSTQGTAICKVFNITVGMTGANERQLKEQKRPFGKVYLHPMGHASYYPGACPISMKLLFDDTDGTILGAQAIGQKGVDKRIDVIAVALRSSMTVYDMENLELSYAPPYGSAKDPINYAGAIAANVLRGDTKIFHANEFTGSEFLIDVRYEAEVSAGTIANSVHIPLEELRDRLDEIPKDKKLVVFCKEGLRAYQACKVLSHIGYDAANLSGGYKTYEMYNFDGSNLAECISPAYPAAANEEQFSHNVVTEIDAAGLSCPGPILKLKLGISSIKEGEALSIVSTDPGFVKDVPTWCKKTGHKLVEIRPANGSYKAIVMKVAQ